MIYGLDGLRAIAFLLVFFFHTDYLEFGWVGVQLFFVLSGFLITGILLKMKQNLSPRDYFVKFYGRRLLRIFPLYYFYLILMLGITAVLIYNGYKSNVMKLFQIQLPYALGYIYNFHYASLSYRHLYFLVHFWSLSVEEQFYIFWPLIIFLTPEKVRKWAFTGIIFAGPLFRILVILAYKYSLLPFLNETLPMGLYPLTFNHIDAFGMGAFIACYPIPKAKLQVIGLTFLLPLTAFFWQYFASGNVGSFGSLGFQFIMPVGYQFIWGYSALNYYFATLIFAVAREGFLIGLLENRMLKYIGRISYGLYVYHNGAIWFAGRIRDYGMDEQFAKPLSTLLAFIMSFVLAALTYRFIEKPFLRLKDQYFPIGSDKRHSQNKHS
jgi:peptidoglycan/LPS O-acetylase OafA/YrhL